MPADEVEEISGFHAPDNARKAKDLSDIHRTCCEKEACGQSQAAEVVEELVAFEEELDSDAVGLLLDVFSVPEVFSEELDVVLTAAVLPLVRLSVA